jgi:hypothetical protein
MTLAHGACPGRSVCEAWANRGSDPWYFCPCAIKQRWPAYSPDRDNLTCSKAVSVFGDLTELVADFHLQVAA